MTKENRLAYSEIVEIFSKMNPEIVEKVPLKLREFFTYNKLPDYVEHINLEQTLGEQNLTEETVTILAMLNLKYWTEDEESKEKLKKIYEENEKIYREKYSTNNLFKDKNKEQNVNNQNLQVSNQKENLLKRIFNKIKKFFKK